MSDRSLRALVSIAFSIAMITLAMTAGPASAVVLGTPPTAVDDALSAAPTGVQDVLANDSDADGDPLSVSASTQPANGTATCSATGACLYSANAGFTGSDSFTYTASDGNGGTTSATVAVTVSASSTPTTLAARDDEAATLAGRAVTIHALANDSGTGLHVVTTGTPQHGTAICAPDGTCQYTPAAGFTGADGFAYTIADGAAQEVSAAVHVLVAPANAGYGLTVGGSPLDPSGGAVPSGGTAWWRIGVVPSPAGISGEELSALPLPSGTASLSGPHSLIGSSVTTARGWNASASGAGAVQLNATSDALLGEALSQSFPKPLPPISQGTGGDGHVPILVGSKVFAFYHHSSPTSATCVDRATGALCPGYPKLLQMSSGNIIGPAAVSGTRMYVHLLPRGEFASYAQSAPIGLFCWDAATDATCGLTIVERRQQTPNPGASSPVLAGGKVWFGGDTGKLYCLEPATGAACATPSLATGLGVSATVKHYDIVTHGARVFLAREGDAVACVDVVAGTTCTGWSTPKAFGGSWNVVNQHDASGATIGVCVFATSTGSCVPDADATASTAVSNWVTTDSFYSVSLEAETGTRTLVGSLGHAGMGCYDWTTMAPCTGGGYDASGWLGGLPSAYGAAWDGACAVGLGDPGQVFTVDPAGSTPCLSLRSGASVTKIDLRDQRCDATVGGAAWQAVKLLDTADGEMQSVVVTVRDAATGAVLKSGDLVGVSGTLDLSGIDPAAHPSITVDANAKSAAGNHAWDDSIPPRILVMWKSDPKQVCVQSAGTAECSGASPTPISLLGHLATPNAADAQASLNLLRDRCRQDVKALRICSGVRRFDIHVRYRGAKVRRIRVTANGRVQQLFRLKPRPVVRIDLRKRPAQTVRVKITIRTKAGKLLKGVRTYHPCTPKRPGSGFKL